MSRFDVLKNEFGPMTKCINGGDFKTAVIDLSYVHVVPVFLTALMQSFGMLEDKINFHVNTVGSEMFVELMTDPGYLELVEALKKARSAEAANEEMKGLIPGYYVYDPRENEYSTIYYDFGDYPGNAICANPFDDKVNELILTMNVVKFGENRPSSLVFPVFRRGDLKLGISKKYDNLTSARRARFDLIEYFYKVAPFNVCYYPITGRVVNLGLKSRKGTSNKSSDTSEIPKPEFGKSSVDEWIRWAQDKKRRQE